MAHPYAGQAKSSEKRRLGIFGMKAGKSFGSTNMYKKSSYPSKGAGTQREFTISGGKGKSRPDRMAAGGSVKSKRRPHATTNIIISHAGGRGGTGGGGGGGRPVAGPVPTPVPVPVGAGPGGPPVGPVPPRPMIAGGPPPVVPARPPMAAGPMGPPGPPLPPVRPPGMKKGGVVKAAKGGFLKEGEGKGYSGYPHSPTKEVSSAVSAHKAGGAVQKRQYGGGGLGTGAGGGGPSTGGGLMGLLGSQAPGRGPQGPQQGPPTISGRNMIPAQPLTVPQPKLAASFLQRPAPGTTTSFKKGGAVHDDEKEDRQLFGKMMKEKGMARGGVVNPGKASKMRGMPAQGSIYHQQGKGFAAGGLVKTPLKNATGGGAGGKGRLAKTRAAKSVPDKTEA